MWSCMPVWYSFCDIWWTVFVCGSMKCCSELHIMVWVLSYSNKVFECSHFVSLLFWCIYIYVTYVSIDRAHIQHLYPMHKGLWRWTNHSLQCLRWLCSEKSIVETSNVRNTWDVMENVAFDDYCSPSCATIKVQSRAKIWDCLPKNVIG